MADGKETISLIDAVLHFQFGKNLSEMDVIFILCRVLEHNGLFNETMDEFEKAAKGK